ncbi:RadC family protein [Marinicauda algicola]|uniref:RadC family protein n=1 Tax=Marinicauda algicola TaxID=2029849 RepID=UPI0019CF9070|nr:DNA repair protein RadC [Marinicauda algicola]
MTAPGPDEPHFHGHRDRLRARFAEAGGSALADYELLELFLFRSIPRRDVKPLAKALIARFGDLGRVVNADPAQLTEVEGISEKVALDLKLLHAASVRIAREQVTGRPVIASWSALLDYCRTALQHASTEEFRVLFLDKKNRLIADEFQARGTVDHAPVYPREIVKRALALDASALILVHNHPSGDPTPSSADIEMTKRLKEAAKPFDIVIHDHLVVGRDKTASFKALGLL